MDSEALCDKGRRARSSKSIGQFMTLICATNFFTQTCSFGLVRVSRLAADAERLRKAFRVTQLLARPDLCLTETSEMFKIDAEFCNFKRLLDVKSVE